MKASIFAMLFALIATMASCGNKTTDDVSTEPDEPIEHENYQEEVPEADGFYQEDTAGGFESPEPIQ